MLSSLAILLLLGPQPPQLPPLDAPRMVEGPLPPAEDVEVELPAEFSDTDPREQTEAPQTEPGGVVVAVPEEEPPTPLPGDPPEDPAEGIEGLDGASPQPEFENHVAVRTAVERQPPPELTFLGERAPPERSAAFVFGYRQFQIEDGLSRNQSWHIVSVDVTPVRRVFRLNLVTEVGIEGGEAAQAGDRADLLIMEKVGLGVQYPHWVTPFVEFQGGMGAARVELFERNDLAMLYSLGVDGGGQWAVSEHLFLHAAVGWIRPYFRVKGETAYYDRLTFKVGLGF